MIQLCRHIKTDGKTMPISGSARVGLLLFPLPRAYQAKAKSSNWDDIKLPLLEEFRLHPGSYLPDRIWVASAPASMRRRTGLLLYALQIASQNIDRKSYHPDSEIVRSMTVTDEGDELPRKRKSANPTIAATCESPRHMRRL